MPRKAKNREQQQQQDEHQEMDIEFDDEPQQQAARIEQIHFDFNNDEEEDLLNAQLPPRPEKMVVMQGGERLVISHIEVDNFKSYFGKQIIGPFHKCFTSIIGPNGSGKSNVIDALLFVFGYRASKIRSKKVSVLIHSSAGRDNLNHCTVIVHFCKIIDKEYGNYIKVNGSEVAISRSAFKDNSSRYAIDGRTVKFKDISELLRTNGIDLVHNRFLILQGEVEQISMMKPKAEKDEEEGMLEYLEDIIGSSRLKPLITKLQNRIEKINERRVLQIQRVQHSEKEKVQLDGPIREVLGQMRLENAITCLSNKIYLAKKFAIEQTLAETKNDKTRMEEELWRAQEKLTEITTQAKQISKERQQLQSKLDKCHEAVQSLEKQRSAQEQIISKTDSDAKRLETKREKILKEIDAEKEKLNEFELAPEKSERKIEELREQLEEAEREIEECSPILMKKLEEVQQSVQAEENEKAKIEIQLGKLSTEEDQLNSDLALAQEKVLNLRREEEAQRRKFDTLQTELLDSEELQAKHENDLESRESQYPELQTTYEGKTVRLKHLHDREQRLNERVRELRRQHEENKQNEESYRSNNKIVDRMMEAKRSGEIPGILGRLGDLGAVDQEYDVAISTNFTQLEYIVVDNIETAQNCIQLLKKEELGTQTFIALNKQQNFWPNIRTVPKTPENTPRIFDLIRVNDEQVLPAFYYAFGDTLITKDIESATRVAMGSGRRWRTITFKGELIEVTGAMTGGGAQQARSRIGREVRVNTGQRAENENLRRQQIHELAQDMSNAEAELAGIRRECNQLEPELRKRQEDLKHLKDAIRDLKLEIENNNLKIADLRKQIEIQKRNVIHSTANPEEVRKAEEEAQQFKSKSDNIAKQTDSLRVNLMSINDRIKQVENKIAGPYKKRKTEAEENKKSAENGIKKERANIAANDRNKNKSKTKIQNLEQDIKNIERQLEAAMEHNSDAKNHLAELDEALDQLKINLEAAKQALNEFVQSIGERNNEEIELQKQVEELRRELKQMDTQLANIEAKSKSYSSKLSKLRLYRLRKLTEALSREVASLPIERNEDDDEDDPDPEDDENDENLDMIDDARMSKQRKKKTQEITDDDLDQFLEDCQEAEETQTQIDREYDEQMQIDEAEDERMEEDGEAAAPNTSRHNTSTASRNHNASTASVRPHAVAGSYLHQQHFMPVPSIAEHRIQEFDIEELENTLEMLESRRKKQQVNLALVKDYIRKINRYEMEFRQLTEITELRDRHRILHDRLKKQRLNEFMEGFQQIATMLRTTYQMITIQGDVTLELVDSLDPFSEGIAFNVRPPKKSWKQITNLSGGEKTLASLSLVFGLHHYKPTPLYVMDEIDAALDFRNVSIIANYLLERTRNAQFIVISLRNQMYEKADRLIGIYKIHDCTKNVCVDPRTKNNENRVFTDDNHNRRIKQEVTAE